MKIAIIADVHFGVRNDNPLFLEEHSNFFLNCFFPYLKNNNVKTLISLGDLVDKRKNINFKTLDTVLKCFIDPIVTDGIDAHMIIGNHDAVFRNTLDLNVYDLLFKDQPVKIYKNVKEVKFENRVFLLVPWMNQENSQEVVSVIQSSNADVCCGHFEVQGMCMTKGIYCKGGLAPSDFIRFDHTFSGHFHIPSESGKVVMVGSPIQFTWNDYGDKKRFVIYDTETGEYESIYLGNNLFHKIDYNNTIDIEKIKSEISSRSFVKVNVISKEDTGKFNKFMSLLEGMSLSGLEVIEPSIYSSSCSTDIPQKSTLEIMHEYVESLDDSVKKNEVKAEITSLYQEAMSRRSTI